MANQGLRQQGRSSWPARLGLIVIGVVVSVAVVVYSTFYFGLIHGEEFSPTTFERRKFGYYEIPLVGFQVSPITHTDVTGTLEEFLVAKKSVPVDKDAQVRWDLVKASRGDLIASPGNAQILCNYFDTVDADDKKVWLVWAEKHVELSKLLWPAIANLARHELYIFIPELLELARQASTPTQFKKAIDQNLTKKYVELAQKQHSLGRHELAIELYSHVLDRSPHEINALQGRAESFDSLGKTKDAAADIALVRKIQLQETKDLTIP